MGQSRGFLWELRIGRWIRLVLHQVRPIDASRRLNATSAQARKRGSAATAFDTLTQRG
jgi:hypothetical protein